MPGSTLDHVVFFADDGTAYTMRINEVPASTGYGEPITKFFKLADQVKVVAAVTTDPRFTPADEKATRRHARRAVHPGRDHAAATCCALPLAAVPRRIDQGGPALRQARRGRPRRDGDGSSARRRASSSRRATATSSTSRSTR